jgi:hypothetical protein
MGENDGHQQTAFRQGKQQEESGPFIRHQGCNRGVRYQEDQRDGTFSGNEAEAGYFPDLVCEGPHRQKEDHVISFRRHRGQ